jgi:hypothetical protein
MTITIMKREIREMKGTNQEKSVSRLLQKPALAIVATAAFALSGNVASASPVAVAAPEVSSWLFGAGVLALLAVELLRRKVAHRKLNGSN